MDRDRVVSVLQTYVGQEALDGDVGDLEATTPLLELGLLDSFSIVGLLSFIEKEFEVQIDLETLTPDNLRDLNSIADLIISARAPDPEGARASPGPADKTSGDGKP